MEIYHGTGKGQALRIQKNGYMKPANTGEEKMSVSFTDDINYARYYAEVKGGLDMAILKTKLSDKFKLSARIRNNQGVEYITFDHVSADDLDILADDGKWHPLTKWNVLYNEPLNKL